MENPYYKTGMENGKECPVLFVQIGGDLTRDKIDLANKALCEWQVRLRMKKKPKDGECPFYQPSTQSMELRSFFGHMARKYDWKITEKDLSGFNGALSCVMEEVYMQREKIWVSDIISISVSALL